MANYNKVLLMGNLTRDVELKYTPSGQAVAKIGLAVNRKWKAADGSQQEETTFVDCDAWGRTAEVMSQYLAKGRPVFVEGRLKLDTWQDKDGSNRSKLKVVIESFQFIDSRGGEGGGPPPEHAAAPARSGGYAPARAQAPAHESIPEDDIPF
jgi:single-strand DNA-binding protein